MKEQQASIVPTTCASHCGGTCVLKAHVKRGAIARIETDDGPEPQLRACLRGRAYRQRVYAPDRLTHPLKRVGAKGEGKFERISWGEALDTVARELIRTRDTYGPASIFYNSGAGDLTLINNPHQIHKLLSLAGGYTRAWGIASYEGGVAASIATYGTLRTSSAREDLPNSRVIIMWGWNPAATVTGTNTCWYLAQAKEAGARIVCIDPRYTDSAAVFADKWIPIRPGTDAALLIAMAYVMLQENLYDRHFLDTYTIGFDQFRDYLLGVEDGVVKDPAWAENITTVPAITIQALAREYATIKPAAMVTGIAPGRTAYGEQYHRAAMTLAAMTGNVGIHGGYAGRSWESQGWYPYKIIHGSSATKVRNPIEEESQGGGSRPFTYRTTGIHRALIADFLLKGKEGGYPADCRLMYIVNTNYLNQYPNINKIVKALKKVDFIVVHEQFMTPIAKFADILLPITTFMERNDIDFGVGSPFYGAVNRAIDPIGKCKSPPDIARELAERMGIDGFEETEDQLLSNEVIGSEIPDYQAFRDKGVFRIETKEPYVPFQKQIEDPANNPFPTPSGKIQIYCRQWADAEDERLPPVPQYIETWESVNDHLHKKYPLQLITTHFKCRALSQFDNIPWLRELEPQAMLISSTDAAVRGIADGDMVRVYNDRGAISIRARLTERIMSGVVEIPHGAWYDPDETGMDRAGSPNVLTRDQHSPAGAFPYNTCLVQVEKVWTAVAS
jgi:anaerobic dimethyl sulfoxide reductase subunit A